MSDTYARFVRMGRDRFGFSVQDLAQRASVDTTTIVRIERGEEVARPKLDAVLSALNIDGFLRSVISYALAARNSVLSTQERIDLENGRALRELVSRCR